MFFKEDFIKKERRKMIYYLLDGRPVLTVCQMSNGRVTGTVSQSLVLFFATVSVVNNLIEHYLNA